MRDVTVIIPAYNEEKSIGAVIAGIRKLHPQARIVVGDNNCCDRTAEIAREMSCEVVRVTEQGKGATVRSLIQHVNTDYTLMTDADATYPAGECIDYFGLLLEHTDIVVGCRRWYVRSAMSSVHKFGNFALSTLASSVYLKPVGDLCSGLWGFKTDKLKRLTLSSDGFDLEADLFSKAARSGLSVTYVPIPYYPRVESKSSLKVLDGVRIAKRLLLNRVRR